MTRLFFLLFLLLSIAQFSYGQEKKIFSLPQGITSQDYEPNTIILKIKHVDNASNARYLSPKAQAEKLKNNSWVSEVNKIFPGHEPPAANPNARLNANFVDISGIYRLKIEDGQDLIEAINQLLQLPEIEYAEPYYITRFFHEPNDPFAHKETGSQEYLKVIKAYEAWEITKGDTNVVIGVLDTGYNPDHEDLQFNIKYNHADPINNFDDDEDGYKDNFAGWDFADNNNKPYADGNGHGTEVLGVCSATNNNEVGIAGTGYHSKFMPLKISRSEDNVIVFQFEAIVYAADKGCKVINLSWGSPGTFSNFAQDIINYAALYKDAVIVAAAGNTHGLLNFYPASYKNVLSVGATDMNDNKATWATYSNHIDLMAPGQGIFTTKNDGSYGSSQGSSFSAPMVAGAAALVRSRFPDLNALQVMERLRITADDIYHLPGNQAYQDKLGYGRLNMHRAVSDFTSPAVRMSEFSYENSFGNYAFFGDTITIKCQFINYLNPTTDAKATISSSSPYVTIINGTFDLGSLGTMATKNNFSSPYKILLSHDTPPGTLVPLRMVFEDGSYEDFQVFEIETSPNYLSLESGKVALTVSGNGNLAYHNDDYNLGLGFKYNNKRILDYMGFMVSTGSTHVYDNVINRFDSKKRNKDFSNTLPIKFYNNGAADVEARSGFEDNSEEVPKLNLKIDQKILKWDNLPENNFLVLEYRITNLSGGVLNDLYTGVFADWDINNRLKNIVKWDEELNLGYIYDPSKPDLFAGIGLLTPRPAGAYAINNISNTTDDFSEDFIFSRSEKYQSLSSGTSNATSSTDGGEVSHVISSYTPNVAANSFEKVAYALVAATSLQELKDHLITAKQKYIEHVNNPPLIFTTLICEGQNALIKPETGNNFRFYSDIGLSDLLSTGSSYLTGPIEEDKIFYLVNIDDSYPSDVMQAQVKINRSLDDFFISPETLILSEGSDNSVQFDDLNPSSVKWSWTFGNGYGSNIKNPKANFTESGEYDIKLVVENSSGCKNTIYKKLNVLRQSADPEINDMKICQGETPEIKAANSSKIKVYNSPDAPYPIFEGEIYKPSGLITNTSFYISNADMDVDSPLKKITIEVSPHKAYFEIRPDSLNLNDKSSFIAVNKSLNSISAKWSINDDFMTENEHLTFNYTSYNELHIRLASLNPEQCEDEENISFDIRKSDAPLISKTIACNGRPAFIKPDNGKNFYFYEDANLTKLIHKGTFYSTNSYSRLFITGVDNFIESDPVEVVIEYKEFHPEFIFKPEVLNLSTSNEVNFTDLGEDNISWHWDMGNGVNHFVKSPVVQYDIPGEYWVTLTAENKNGCTESISRKLLVVNITENKDEILNIEPSVKVFPNPSNGNFFIDFENHTHHIVEIKLVDNMSRLLFSDSLNYEGIPLEVDFHALRPGIYFLQAQTTNGFFFKKIIINQ